MPTTGDLNAFNDSLRRLATALVELAYAETRENAKWRVVILDARFSDDGSISDKVRATLATGAVTSLSPTSSIILDLIALGEARPDGKNRWYGFRMEVATDGKVNVEFDYNSACVDDPQFFES